ncbi:MAG: D-alanine--D-alanine ligase [Flavobacteriales bacterium]
MNLKSRIHRLIHWEYWPMWAIYLPVMPFWFYYSLRARSFFFFSASNPGIKNGGMAMESKMDIYNLIPSQFIPKTFLVDGHQSIYALRQLLQNAGISYPLIVKPDIGMKAFAVCKIKNEEELIDYASTIGEAFIVQELIVWPREVGVFYHRFPKEEKGKITGIVEKEFLKVVGDGIHTIDALINMEPRSAMRIKALQKLHGDHLQTILEPGEEFVLVPFGSHTRGAKFIDASNHITAELEHLMDTICKPVSGFYFGRLDIRFDDMESLQRGKHFSVIEINGAGSEPTHMYDPSHSLLFAWKEIINHWRILFAISRENRKVGHTNISFQEGMRMIADNKKREAKLKLI